MDKSLRAWLTRALMGAVLIQLPFGGRHTVALAAVPHANVDRGRTLYTWTFPQSGRRGAWQFAGHVLQYDGRSNGVLLAHVNLHSVTSFAVQATMQGLGPGGPESDPTGFGLVIRQRPAAPNMSVRGGSFFSGSLANNNPELAWNGDTVGGATFQPHRSWHLYRLEVRPSLYTLLIDGKEVVEYPIADYAHPTNAGIFSAYYRIRVKSFTVFSLTAAGTPAPITPPTKPFNLTLSDLPATTFFEPTLRHYSTNQEIARERGVTLSSLLDAGQLGSYKAAFEAIQSSKFLSISSTVSAFETVDEARSDVVSRLDATKQHAAQQPNLQILASVQVGDKSGGLIFDVDVGDAHYTTLVLSFARGRYTALQQVAIVRGGLSQDELLTLATTLAKVVDGRLQRAQPARG